MKIQIHKTYLKYNDQSLHGLIFLPDPAKPIRPYFGIFTHGYTSHKGSILPWALRLSEQGIPIIIFDLPGHYLGGFSEVDSFEDFTTNAHLLFEGAFSALSTVFSEYCLDFGFTDASEKFELLLGGHSLGALLSLSALNIKSFEAIPKRAICVGLGLPEKDRTHLFETPFYKTTLLIREQLVSPALNSKNIFGWVKKLKESIQVANKKVHIIVGDNDLVVGERGAELLQESLDSKGNFVTLDKIKNLPHHEPELAGSYIKKYLKHEGII